MAQSFYTKWQYAFLADAGCYVSREYRNFQTALLREISKYAKAVDAAVVAKTKGHYFTSRFVERNGKFVYINHSSGLIHHPFIFCGACPRAFAVMAFASLSMRL